MRKAGQAFSGWWQNGGHMGARTVCAAAIVAGAALSALPAAANAEDLSYNSRYAGIVVDAQSGEVLYSARADAARYPASLTKIMTLYMVFDALERGDIKPTDMITVSAHAAGQAPVKVYLRAGDEIDVDTAMRLAAMYSANDMAVALAERVAGNEQRFAAMMTVKAQELGMTQTHFVNANGLPDPRQISSARDLAILARAVMRDFPQYYSYFDLNSVTYRGRTYYNHNPLHGVPGVDGMKTGYTNAAGQNLVASQVIGNHRLIAVMLGAADKEQRRETVSELLNVGFDVENRRDHGEVIQIAQAEFDKALNGRETHGYGYTLMASNTAPAPAKPFSDSELRDTLQASEQANATDSGVEQAKATVKAPEVVAALTGTTPQSQPIPYAQLASADQAATPAAAIATQAAPVAKPIPANVAQQEAAVKVALAQRAKATTVAKADDDSSDDDRSAGRKGKHKKNPDAVWSIQVGAFKEKSLANNWIHNIQRRFDDALADASSSVQKTGEGWYRTRFASLTKEQAHEACRSMTAKHLDCMVVRPDEG